MSIVQAGVGIGCLVYAPLSQTIIENIGWQGAMLMTSGLCLQMCITGALMRPVSRHKLQERAGKFSDICKNDANVFRDVRFIVFWWNNLLWNAGFLIVFLLLVDYLCKMQNFPELEAVMMLSIIAICNTVGRPIAGFMGTHRKCNRMHLYNFATAIYGIVIVLYVIDGLSFIWYAAFSTVFGLFLGMQCGILPTLTADLFGVETLVSSFGYLMISNGVGNMIGPPVAGNRLTKTDCR